MVGVFAEPFPALRFQKRGGSEPLELALQLQVICLSSLHCQWGWYEQRKGKQALLMETQGDKRAGGGGGEEA